MRPIPELRGSVDTENGSVPPLTVRLFGPMEVFLHGEPFPHLRSRKDRWLLALLTLHAGRELERRRLAGLLWPESPEATALVNLRSSLKDLRRALGDATGVLRAPRPRTLSLDPTGVDADVLAFDAAIARGDHPQPGVPELEAAVTLYRGPLLEGCTELWAFEERRRREEAFLQVLEALAALGQRAGDWAAAECHLRRAIATDPLREAAHRGLMQVLAASGSYAAALQVYRDLRFLLHREVNAEPDPETRALFETLRDDQRGREGARVRGCGGVTLGMRDPLSHPRTLGSEATLHNLPSPVTRFIGREAEMAELRRLLEATRLLTLTGVGGCGKSRLALEVAHDWREEMPDGVWSVELASLAVPALLPQVVAGTLDVRERPGEALTETLVGALKRRQMLVLLDNCEHLLPPCVALVEALLRGCPGLRVLATSREPLGMLGETAYRVPGLPRSEAVRLFVDRAVAVAPSFSLTPQNADVVALICQRLDGMPLALEMAAARVRAIPVETVADRIGDAFRLLTDGNRAALPRHQTLRATIEWSYDLLSEPERALLRRLSVFSGGWTLEAAEAVGGGRHEVLDLLTALVDKSLVVYERRGGEGWYRLLETIRQFAWGALTSNGEAEATRRRHVEYYLGLAETWEPRLLSWDRSLWFDRVERELDNLRAVLAWAAAPPGLALAGEAAEIGLRLMAAARYFWRVRGHATEGRDWIAKLLFLSGGDAPDRSGVSAIVRARAFHAAGGMAWQQGDGNAARALHQEGLRLAREAHNRDQIARSLQSLGNVAQFLGEFDTAQAHQEESLAIFRELGNRQFVGMLLNNRSMPTREHGDYQRARALLEESIRILRELGNPDVKNPLAILGTVHTLQGNYPEALTCLKESLTISRDVGDVWHVGVVLDYTGTLARYQGDLETAHARHMEAVPLHHSVGNRGELMRSLVGLGCVAAMTGEKAAGSSEEARPCFARGARLFGAAETLHQATGWVDWLHDRGDHERCVAVAREALGEAAFAAAWAEGRAMTLDQACELALDEGHNPSRERTA